MRRLIHCEECGRNAVAGARQLCKRCYMRGWWEQHPNYKREWRKNNPDKVEAYNAASLGTRNEERRQYRQEHQEQERAYRRQYNQEHKAERNACKRRWRRDNRERVCAQKRSRRAQKKGATVEQVDEQAIYELYNHTCIYCGRHKDLTLDHVMALANGGAHSEDNLVVACRSCNSRKRITPLGDWLQTQPKALAWVM